LIYKGGCHCGRISFQVDGNIDQVLECNCSICTKRGYLLWFVDRHKLKLLTPEANLSTYTFNKHHIKHRFCSVCGCGPFGEAADQTGKSKAAINVRCLENVDLSKIKRVLYDGKSL
jgi:hypothetical protein